MSQTITLNLENSIKLLVEYINLAQKNGAYSLQEADTLERGVGLLKGEPSKSDLENGLNCLIGGVVKGQKHGSYSLSDASILYNIIVFLTSPASKTEVSTPIPQVPMSQVPMSQVPVESSMPAQDTVQDNNADDTFDLSESIPLRPNITRL
jgi:hypothetical protein